MKLNFKLNLSEGEKGIVTRQRKTKGVHSKLIVSWCGWKGIFQINEKTKQWNCRVDGIKDNKTWHNQTEHRSLKVHEVYYFSMKVLFRSVKEMTKPQDWNKKKNSASNRWSLGLQKKWRLTEEYEKEQSILWRFFARKMMFMKCKTEQRKNFRIPVAMYSGAAYP